MKYLKNKNKIKNKKLSISIFFIFFKKNEMLFSILVNGINFNQSLF
jgi:hypothetical protein